MSNTENKTALAFMAHPDDAEFHCGGTLIRLVDAGWDVHICTVANGDCGTLTETRWTIAGIRTVEADRAAKMIGATYHCLGESDGLVVFDQRTIQKAVDLFRRITPSLVFIHPRQDYMMDHEMSSLLGRSASFMFGTPNASEFPLHPATNVPHMYYCDPVEARDPYGNIVKPTTYVDIAAVLDRKTDMLACHASQRDWLRAYHGDDEYLHSMQRAAAMRGEQAGMAAAEGFIQHRGHAYPRNDLLEELFGKAGTAI